MSTLRYLRYGAPHNVLEANIFWNRVWKRLVEVKSGIVTDYAAARMFHHDATVIAGNGLTSPDLRNTYWPFDAAVRQFPAAVDDEFENSCFVPNGTYDLMVMGLVDGNSGIVQWSIDEDVVGTQDWYDAVGSSVPVVKTVSDVAIEAGWKTINGLVTGKNASSGSYHLRLMKYALRRTGA